MGIERRELRRLPRGVGIYIKEGTGWDTGTFGKRKERTGRNGTWDIGSFESRKERTGQDTKRCGKRKEGPGWDTGSFERRKEGIGRDTERCGKERKDYRVEHWKF